MGWTPLNIVLSSNESVIGIAPLNTKKKFGVRFATFPLEGTFSPDFILNEQHRKICVASILDFLFKTLNCQFVDLTLPMESRNLEILRRKCQEKQIHICVRPGHWAKMGHNILLVDRSWIEFEKLRGRNFTRRFKRIKRKLENAGSTRITCIEKGDKRSDTLARILDVERMSWKQVLRNRKGVNIDHTLLWIWRGLQNMARKALDFNWKVWFLEFEGHPIAYSLSIQYKETAFFAKTSYDDRYRRFSPGKYIVNEAIRELFNKRQVKKIDFLTNLPFHQTWTSISASRVRLILSRKNLVPFVLGHLCALLPSPWVGCFSPVDWFGF